MAKKKLPKVLALLDEDMCTGCEACLVVCPVDCISTIPGPRMGYWRAVRNRVVALELIAAELTDPPEPLPTPAAAPAPQPSK